MTSSGDDTRVGTTVPSTLVDPSSRTKTISLKKTTSAGSSKEDAPSKEEKELPPAKR